MTSWRNLAKRPRSYMVKAVVCGNMSLKCPMLSTEGVDLQWRRKQLHTQNQEVKKERVTSYIS